MLASFAINRVQVFVTVDDDEDSDLRGKKPGDHMGAGADVDFLRRYRPHVRRNIKGVNKSIAAKSGLPADRVSKVRAGQGTADDVFKAARAARIAPPRRFLDDAQYHLLDGLEALRKAAESRFGDDGRKIDGEVQALLNRFDEALGKLLTHEGGAAPLPRAGSGRE